MLEYKSKDESKCVRIRMKTLSVHNQRLELLLRALFLVDHTFRSQIGAELNYLLNDFLIAGGEYWFREFISIEEFVI